MTASLIRAVLDANVIVAGLASASGTPSRIIDYWLNQVFHLAVSEYILGEVDAAWRKPYWRTRFSRQEAEAGLILLRSDAEQTTITVPVTGIAAHEEDDPVLATAVNAGAAFLVTGDRELQELRTFAGVQIVSPRRFLTILDGAERFNLAHRT